MTRITTAALAYFLTVFGLGFALGTLRVLFIIPRIGETAAVLLELPVMLAASWVAAGWCVRRFAVPPRTSARLAMGLLAFALVMVAELGLAVLLFGQSPAQHFAAYRHFAGAAGLAAQGGYALFPALRRVTPRYVVRV
ncbi:hypothetical protein BH10PSE14_BH10PSE14_19640 [soil metagenome]